MGQRPNQKPSVIARKKGPTPSKNSTKREGFLMGKIKIYPTIPQILAITEGFWLGLWPMIRSFSPLFVQYLISKPNQRFLI